LSRILYVEEASAFGGSTSTLLHLVKRLDRRRHEPFVLFRFNLPARETFAAHDIPTATWASIRGAAEEAPRIESAPEIPACKRTDAYRLLWSVKQYVTHNRADSLLLEGWIRREGFSLLHANNAASANLGAILAAARVGIPVLSHQRGFFPLTAFRRRLVRKVERFVCVSNAVRYHYIDQGLSAARVLTIYDGVDLTSLTPRPPRHGNRVKIGWFARFERWKGCSQFVDAARIVLDQRDDAEFIMAGTGPEEALIRKMAQSDPILAGRFSVPGFRKDAPELMALCDIVVNSSIEPEPLSNTALEALALGLPVVASNRGGNPEIVDHGVTGLLYEALSPRSLAEALVRLVADAGLRDECGRAARARAERLFDADAYARRVQDLYAEIIED